MSMAARAALVAVLTTWAMFTASNAAAQSHDDATIEAVNAHFTAGAQLYYDEQYDAAIEQFEHAHAKIPNAIFLYNISLAQQKKGELRAALKTARQAEELGGLGEDERVQNQARIAAMQRAVAAEQASLAVDRGGSPLSVVGWTGVGVAAGGAIGLLAVAVLDVGLAPDVAEHKNAVERGDARHRDEIAARLRPRQRTARVLFAASTIAVAAGTGLLVYDIFFNDGDTALTATPTTDGVAVVWRHHF